MAVPALLVIDDEPLILDCFQYLFPKGQVTVLTARSGAEGIDQFARQRPDVVIVDVRLPDLSGLEVFRRLHEVDAKIPIVLITGYGTAETAIAAMRLGAYEYVVKPLDPNALRELLLRAFEISRLMRVPALVSSKGLADDGSDVLVGNCPAMQEVYKAIGRVAPQPVTVLVLGESGTGKELVARAIYHYSDRSAGPFLAVNCAAIPETLLESELFGHEKGAFTGADRRRIGKFEQCNGGTLFLDEIGDMTPLTQTKILRVLQNGQFERVGGNESIKADIRILAATNRDLTKLIAEGQFREDLYYRLNAYTIHLPPLRERTGDFPLLIDHFLRRFSRELHKEMHGVAPEALAVLQNYRWPGNVRQLQSVLKQSLLQATAPVLLPHFLPAWLFAAGPSESAPGQEQDLGALTRFIEGRLQGGSTNLYEEFQALVERHLLVQVLRHTQGNQSQAAKILGINRTTLRTKLAFLGISIERSTAVEEDFPG